MDKRGIAFEQLVTAILVISVVIIILFISKALLFGTGENGGIVQYMLGKGNMSWFDKQLKERFDEFSKGHATAAESIKGLTYGINLLAYTQMHGGTKSAEVTKAVKEFGGVKVEYLPLGIKTINLGSSGDEAMARLAASYIECTKRWLDGHSKEDVLCYAFDLSDLPDSVSITQDSFVKFLKTYYPKDDGDEKVRMWLLGDGALNTLNVNFDFNLGSEGITKKKSDKYYLCGDGNSGKITVSDSTFFCSGASFPASGTANPAVLVEGFELPQENPDDEWILANEDPKYVLFYEQFPAFEDLGWMNIQGSDYSTVIDIIKKVTADYAVEFAKIDVQAEKDGPEKFFIRKNVQPVLERALLASSKDNIYPFGYKRFESEAKPDTEGQKEGEALPVAAQETASPKAVDSAVIEAIITELYNRSKDKGFKVEGSLRTIDLESARTNSKDILSRKLFGVAVDKLTADQSSQIESLAEAIVDSFRISNNYGVDRFLETYIMAVKGKILYSEAMKDSSKYLAGDAINPSPAASSEELIKQFDDAKLKLEEVNKFTDDEVIFDYNNGKYQVWKEDTEKKRDTITAELVLTVKKMIDVDITQAKAMISKLEGIVAQRDEQLNAKKDFIPFMFDDEQRYIDGLKSSVSSLKKSAEAKETPDSPINLQVSKSAARLRMNSIYLTRALASLTNLMAQNPSTASTLMYRSTDLAFLVIDDPIEKDKDYTDFNQAKLDATIGSLGDDLGGSFRNYVLTEAGYLDDAADKNSMVSLAMAIFYLEVGMNSQAKYGLLGTNDLGLKIPWEPLIHYPEVDTKKDGKEWGDSDYISFFKGYDAPGLLSIVDGYYLELQRDEYLFSTQKPRRFYLVSPCKADIYLYTDQCQCGFTTEAFTKYNIEGKEMIVFSDDYKMIKACPDYELLKKSPLVAQKKGISKMNIDCIKANTLLDVSYNDGNNYCYASGAITDPKTDRIYSYFYKSPELLTRYGVTFLFAAVTPVAAGSGILPGFLSGVIALSQGKIAWKETAELWEKTEWPSHEQAGDAWQKE